MPVIRFHDLRHSAVYALCKGGCDAKDIQAWLGQNNITTALNVYGHVLGGEMDRLGKVMDKVLFDAVKGLLSTTGCYTVLWDACGTFSGQRA